MPREVEVEVEVEVEKILILRVSKVIGRKGSRYFVKPTITCIRP